MAGRATGTSHIVGAALVTTTRVDSILHVPMFREGRFAGGAVGIYSLRKIVQASVPWWLAQRNHIGVLDLDGRVLASRSGLEQRETASSHRILFDPPGHGLVLLATPIRPAATWTGKFLAGSLVLLAVLVVWSLWALRRDCGNANAADRPCARNTPSAPP